MTNIFVININVGAFAASEALSDEDEESVVVEDDEIQLLERNEEKEPKDSIITGPPHDEHGAQFGKGKFQRKWKYIIG